MTDTILDTPSTGASLSLGGNANTGTIDAVPESGSFDTTFDHDWWAVNLTAGDDYAFFAQFQPGNGNLNNVAIELRDGSRNILNGQGVVNGAAANFTYSAISSGNAYVDISAGIPGQTGDYFIFGSDLGPDTVLDTAATNASLSLAGASGRINGMPESGSFNTSLDHDWFAVSLIAGHDYTFSAQGTISSTSNLKDVAIDLRDASRAILNSQGVVDAGANTAGFTYTATSSGTVYFDISAGGNNPASLTGDYQISYADDGSDTILDTASTNASLMMGGTTSGRIYGVPEVGSFDTSLDHDWFAVNLVAGHDYTFSAQATPGPSENLNDVAINLRDSSRTILNSQGTVDRAQPSFTYTATSSGTVYFDISAGGNNPASLTGNYQITVNDNGVDTVLDTAATNASLTMGVTTPGRINGMPESGSFNTSVDHDWFAVNLIAGHSYTFLAQGTSGNLNDVAIELMDSNRTILNSQGLVDAGANATSSFTYTATTSGTEYLAIGAGGNNPAALAGNYQIGVADNGLVLPPGMTINLIYDTNALNAPQSFRDGMQAAANILEAAFNDNITINIAVGYGEFGGVALSSQNKSEGNIGSTGDGTSGVGISESYSTLRDLLQNYEGSMDDITAVNSLPVTSSLEGHSTFIIGSAQGKALGVVSPRASAIDGQVGMGTAFTGTDLITAALHEITHAMGRIAGDSLDLFRFNENRSGSRVFGFSNPAAPAYFSIDGGVTDLADFGINSDPGDFLNGGVQGPDPFNEFTGAAPALTPVDLKTMDVLGFHLTPLNLQWIGTGDFNNDGKGDIAWALNGGQAALWMNSNGTLQQIKVPGGAMGAEWTAYGVGDFNNDGNSDLLWTKASGQAAVWELNGSNLIGFGVPAGQMGAEWHVAAMGDFNGDHKSDLLWLNTNRQTAVWTMNGTALAGFGVSNGAMGAEWNVMGTGDFNGDGRDDVLWENPSSGAVDIWEMNGANLSGFDQNVGTAPGRFAGVGHFAGSSGATSDIVWVDSTNHVTIWEMRGGHLANTVSLNGLDGLAWHLEGVGKFANDGNSDLLWISDSGALHTWAVNGTGVNEIPISAPIGNHLQLQAGTQAPSTAPAVASLTMSAPQPSMGAESGGLSDTTKMGPLIGR
jgi:FG-GAP-like repeat